MVGCWVGAHREAVNWIIKLGDHAVIYTEGPEPRTSSNDDIQLKAMKTSNDDVEANENARAPDMLAAVEASCLSNAWALTVRAWRFFVGSPIGLILSLGTKMSLDLATLKTWFWFDYGRLPLGQGDVQVERVEGTHRLQLIVYSQPTYAAHSIFMVSRRTTVLNQH
jgi:hypothetical protein